MIDISILAPLVEEIVFRKTINTIINNKWIGAIISGILFGMAHIMVNLTSNTFNVTDLLYILPYAALGINFYLMDCEVKSTFGSIVIHGMHNFATGLLLITVLGGLK